MAAIRPMQTSQKREGLPDVVLPLRKVEDRRKRTDCCRSSSPRSGRASPRPLENNRLELQPRIFLSFADLELRGFSMHIMRDVVRVITRTISNHSLQHHRPQGRRIGPGNEITVCYRQDNAPLRLGNFHEEVVAVTVYPGFSPRGAVSSRCIGKIQILEMWSQASCVSSDVMNLLKYIVSKSEMTARRLSDVTELEGKRQSYK